MAVVSTTFLKESTSTDDEDFDDLQQVRMRTPVFMTVKAL